VIGAVDGQVIHCLSRLVLEILGQVHQAIVPLEELVGHLPHPVGDGCGEEANLQVSGVHLRLDGPENLLDVFFEAELEHLVGFVEDDGLDFGEANVASVDVVEHTTRRSHEEVHSTLQLPSLVLDGDTTVNSKHTVLVLIVLQLAKLSRDLYRSMRRLS